MIVSINQPAYLPWLGYFHRIAVSDMHIVLDHVQFEKNSFVNRNKIRTAQGWNWLTIPVRTSGKFGDLPINKLEIENKQAWMRKHRDSIRFAYAKAPFFKQESVWLDEFYSQPRDLFGEYLLDMNKCFLEKLRINTRLLCSSAMNVSGKKDQLVLNLCKEVGATSYLSGPLGRDYLNSKDFEAAGIELKFHNYSHPHYPQLHGEFLPFMSTIDLLFNAGKDSPNILMSSLAEEGSSGNG